MSESNVVKLKGQSVLPFADLQAHPRQWWKVEETGDWAEDNATGRHYAVLMVRYMRAHQAQPALAYVISAMIEHRSDKEKPLGPIEVGFLGGIADALL